AADLAASTLETDLSEVTADGVEEATLTVVVKDSYGNPVSGSSVVLEAGGSGNDLVQPVGVTGSDGTATGTLSSTVAERKTVRGRIDGSYMADSVQIDFTAGTLDYFEISHDGYNAAGNGENISIQVLDAEGNLITNYAGTVEIFTNTAETEDRISWGIGTGTGSIISERGDTLEYQFAQTDGGEVTFILTDLEAEVINIFAESGIVTSTSPALTVDHSVQDRILISSGDGQRAVVNSPVPQPLVVRVEDQYSNPVDNSEVTFSVAEGGGDIDTDTLTAGLQSSSYTGTDGLAYCESWVLGTVSGVNSDRVSAVISSGSGTLVQFTATSDHDGTDSITLTPSSGDVTVSSSTRLEAELRDSFGNLVTGQETWIYIKDQQDGYLSEDTGNPNPTTGHGAGTRSGITDSTGTISVIYNAPSSAGLADIIDAYHSLVPAEEVADVQLTSVASGATRLAVQQVIPQPVQAGETFSLVVRAEDSNGNLDLGNNSHISLSAQAGGVISFSLTDFGAEITEADLVNGEVTLYGKGEKEGNWSIHIEASAPVLTAVDSQVEIIPDSTIAYYHVSAPTGAVAGENFSLEVRARDAFANFITSASRYIQLRAVDEADTTLSAGNPLSVSGGTISGGIFSSQLVSYDRAERIRIEVTDTVSSIVNNSGILDIDHASAFRLVELGGDSTMVTAGDSVLLRAAVEDNFGNRVDSETVSFAVIEGGGGIESAQRSTRGDGSTSVGYRTGTGAGTNRIRAAILDGSPEGLETVMYEVGTVPGSEIDYVELAYQGSEFYAGESISCSVSAFDSNGNLVASDSTTRLLPVAETPGLSFFPDTLTLNGGMASFEAVDTLSGQNRISIESISGEVLYPFNQYITIIPAPAYRITEINGDTTGVISGDAVELKSRVSDMYGNVIENEVVRFTITSDLGGTPSLIDGTGDSADGLVLSDGSGTAACSLLTDTQAGVNEVDASILDGDPADREVAEFTVGTSAGNISRYQISVDRLVQDAGIAFDAEIVAYDLNDNIAFGDDTTRVVPGSDGSAVFSGDTLTLTDGSATVTVIDSTAESIALSAETAGGGALSYSDTITVLPGAPTGTIGIFSVIPDTITANGTSRSAITTEPVTDQYGNIVAEGNQITVSTTAGTIPSDDLNETIPGVQRETGGSGRVSVFVTSSSSPGVVSVDFESVEGSGSGSAQLIFASPPDIRYGDYISPHLAVPDSSVTFRCGIENASPTGLYINPSSSISFSDGSNTFSSTLSSGLVINAFSADTLDFQPSVIPSGFAGGTYTPEISIQGNDIYSSAYTGVFDAAANSVAVSTVEIVDITPERAVMSRGDTAAIDLRVRNGGGVNAIIRDLQLQFSNGDYSNVGLWSPSLNDTLPPGITRTYTRDIRVLPFSPIGPDTVDAVVHATINGGMDVYDYSAGQNRGTLLIQSGSRLSYVDQSLAPETVSRGQEHSFSIMVENLGEAAVIINSAQTYIQFTDLSETYTALAESGGALTGGGTSDMVFSAGEIPVSMAAGTYPVTLRVNGNENGAVFDTSFALADSVEIVNPAELEYIPESISPVLLSKGSSVAFSAGINNNGGAEVEVVEDSTFINFTDGSEQFRAYLQDQPGVTLLPGANTVYFRAGIIPEGMATGDYEPVLGIRGYENGISLNSLIMTGDTLSVQNPSQIAINRTTLPDRITADQSSWWEAVIELENNGEASVRLDSIRCRLYSGADEVTGQYILTQLDFTPGVEVLIGGQVDSFRVRLEDNTANSMITGMIVMESAIWGTDLNSSGQLVATTESGGRGGFLVETPAVPVVEGIYPSVEKATVLQDRDWTLDVAISNQGESDLQFSFDTLQTYLVFSTSDDFALDYPSGFLSGGTVLQGGGRDTIRITVDVTGSSAGDCTVNIEAAATEINSGRVISPITAGPSATAEVTVQSPAQLVITGVSALQNPVTVGQSNQWSIDLGLRNDGGSELQLDTSNHDSTYVEIPQGSGFVYQFPDQLLEGGSNLAPADSGTLRYEVITTGTVPAGRRVMTGSAAGTELNSGETVYYRYGQSVSTDSVTFQLPPSPAYIQGSLSPAAVSKGTDIQLLVELAGGGLQYATLTLDRTETYAHFADAQGDTFRAVLSPISSTELQGSGSTLLTFESTRIDTAVDDGSYQVKLHLEGQENGNHYQTDITSGADQITVEEAPRLSITSIINPASVTATLQPAWEIRMVLHNSGEASLDLDLSEDKTYLNFSIPPAGDVT
ncbi:MAG: hypothetical protein GF417_11080, partial [Candidatus Latescibacteria bacterium]|nr:hypothetical protein [Candidatus Latescibacterota bacterium]